MSARAALRSAASAAFSVRPAASRHSPAAAHALTAHRRSRAFPRAYSSSAQTPASDAENASAEQPQTKADADPCADVSAKLKAKEAEVVDVTGRLRYLQADFLNLQRNAAREKEQTRDFAISRFAGDLLETVDVLALALKSVPVEYTAAATTTSPPSSASSSSSSTASSPASASSPPAKPAAEHLRELYNGVELTHRLLLQTLFKYHVKPFDPTGDRFDPNRHEALYQAPVPGKEPGSVIDCQKIGYTIKDRVLRAAQVGVAQETQS